jgi:acylphosphatase
MEQKQNKAISAQIFGMVQGVGFRYSALDKARRLGVKGYVRNMSDGSVEVIAEGGEDSINTFLAWLKKGPPGALVRRVDFRSISYQGLYRSFTIEF